MSEITELHEPFMRWLKQEGILYRRSRSDRATSEACGEPDFSLHRRNQSLFIEFKQPKSGKLSKEQVFRHAEYERVGCHVHVLRDLCTAMELVEAWRSQAPEPARSTGETIVWKGMGFRKRQDGTFERLLP